MRFLRLAAVALVPSLVALLVIAVALSLYG